MKSEKGLGLVGLFLILIVIIGLIIFGIFFVKDILEKEELSTIETDMLLIKAKVKLLQEDSKVKKDNSILEGQKLSEIENKEGDLKSFLELDIIPEEDYDKHYLLSKDDLVMMGLDTREIEESSYLVNYETQEVYITKGFYVKKQDTTVYRLTDIEELEHES